MLYIIGWALKCIKTERVLFKSLSYDHSQLKVDLLLTLITYELKYEVSQCLMYFLRRFFNNMYKRKNVEEHGKCLEGLLAGFVINKKKRLCNLKSLPIKLFKILQLFYFTVIVGQRLSEKCE